MMINEKLLPEKDYIIEYGGNKTTGYWEKWKSGKLVQHGEVVFTAPITTSATTGWYRTADNQQKNFPVPFKDTTYEILLTAMGGTVNIAYPNMKNVNYFNFFPMTNWSVNNQNAKYIFYQCTGRWK